jgi:hypothetical protein
MTLRETDGGMAGRAWFRAVIMDQNPKAYLNE